MEDKMNLGFWGENPEHYFLLKEENRKTILFPAVAALIGLNKGSKILDYGGGDGSFLESFIDNSFTKYLYDPSEGMIESARKNRHTIDQYELSDEKIPDDFFDVITLIHVVTIIKEDSELKRIFMKVKKLLKNGGSFIIGMTHPAFKNNFFSTFHTDFSIRKVEYDYLKNGLPYFVHLNDGSEFLSFECYHRSISTVMNFLIGAGFIISEVLEVEDRDFNQPAKKFYFPPFLIIRSNKRD